MKFLSKILSLVVGLINVWLFRSNKATSYRLMHQLLEEFQVYGLDTIF